MPPRRYVCPVVIPPDRWRVVGTLADGTLYADDDAPEAWQDQGLADWRQITMTTQGHSVKIIREYWDVGSETWRERPC
jgi:hypothetical protein